MIYTLDAVKETATYKELESKKESVKLKIIQSRASRERISNAVQVYKNTRSIPTTVSGFELAIVRDFIAMQQTDRAWDMTVESINLSDDE